MTALGEWLKQLILIVMLGVFADLLLPTKAMQKYVRMVMGLAVIAAMLQPLVPLLRRDWADQAASLAMAEAGGQNQTVMQGGSTGLPSIAIGNQTLATETNQTADELLASRLQREIATRYHCHVERVQVTGDAEQDQLRVTVSTGPLRAAVQRQITAYVAKELGIATSSVVVNAV